MLRSLSNDDFSYSTDVHCICNAQILRVSDWSESRYMAGAVRNYQDEKPTLDQLLETLNLALEQADKLGLALVAVRICHAIELSEQWRKADSSPD